MVLASTQLTTDLSNPNNWRGMTLLAVIAKLVCSVLSNRMTSHMQVIGLEAQCGFMPGNLEYY